MKNDGGPAFGHDHISTNGSVELNCGMTLRDYFAGAFLMSASRIPGCELPANKYDVAKQCYEMADEMIKERSK